MGKSKIPTEMEVAPSYKLLTLLHTAYRVRIAYIASIAHTAHTAYTVKTASEQKCYFAYM